MSDLAFCEPWIEAKLTARLMLYKQRYPNFKWERVLLEVTTWDDKSQRWAPYMTDTDIKKINRANQRIRSWSSQAASQS